MRWWWLVLAACKAPGGPALHVDAKVQPLLDAWADAVGGRVRLAQVHATHEVGTYRDGSSTGAFEDWANERGEHRHESVADGIRYVTVFDGTRAWDVDASGLVLELDGPALDHERNSAFRASGSLLVPGRLGGDVTLVGDNLIEIMAAGSHRSFEVRLDPATHLPAATIEVVGGYRMTTTFADWHDVDGILEPATSRSTGAETEGEGHVDKLDQAPGDFTAPHDRDDDVHFAATPVDVPLEVGDEGELHVDASINGAPPVKLILDTGAVTLVDPARIPGAPLAVVGSFDLSGVTGVHRGGYVRDVTITVGGLRLGTYTLRTVDMADTYSSHEEAGLLGAELFQHVVVEIDYEHGRLRLYDPRSYVHPAGGVELPLTFRERSPAIDATLEAPDHTAMSGAFLVDTGCSCELVVVAAAVKRHALLDHMPERTREAIPSLEFRRAAALVLGSERIASPTVMLSVATGKGILASASELGYIGGQTLRRYRVTFDYPHKRMWLDR